MSSRSFEQEAKGSGRKTSPLISSCLHFFAFLSVDVSSPNKHNLHSAVLISVLALNNFPLSLSLVFLAPPSVLVSLLASLSSSALIFFIDDCLSSDYSRCRSLWWPLELLRSIYLFLFLSFLCLTVRGRTASARTWINVTEADRDAIFLLLSLCSASVYRCRSLLRRCQTGANVLSTSQWSFVPSPALSLAAFLWQFFFPPLSLSSALLLLMKDEDSKRERTIHSFAMIATASSISRRDPSRYAGRAAGLFLISLCSCSVHM